MHECSAGTRQDSKKRSRMQKYPGSWISRTQHPGYCGILDLICPFCRVIVEILDPVTSTLSWDSRDLWSRTEKMLLDPESPWSYLAELSWDHADPEFCTTIMSLDLQNPLHPMRFWFYFPISMRYLNLRTVQNFNHILIQPCYIDS